jgi:hypothetical protein
MDRPRFLEKIDFAFEVHPVVAILGPRQCGKTTLAQMYAEREENTPVTTFDLENPTHLARLGSPLLALQDLRGLVVIDEIQRAPGLFEVLRVLADRRDRPARFLILGSASRELIRQSSESLAGRIDHIELTPFSLAEVGVTHLRRLWTRGGYPPSYLAKNEQVSARWREAYISTFLERDIPALGITIPSSSLRRFWMMLTHYHGQLVNYSEFGRSFGVADTTVRRYIDMLSATFMVRQLPPWFENIGKRQVKAPKIYIRDSGLLHTLLGVEGPDALHFHPKIGPSWEGFAIEEIIRKYQAAEGECYFWSAYGRAELDLLIIKGGKRIGFEVKHTDTPKATKSLLAAQKELSVDELYVVYPGRERFPLTEFIHAVGLADLVSS